MASKHQPLDERAGLLSRWLQRCNERHGSKCHITTPIAERSGRHLPDWVIDTEQGRIVPGKSVDRYAALSYVWSFPLDPDHPASTDRLLLQRDTLQDLQTPGFLYSEAISKRLPVVVRDSITLTLQSGARYLWVDCLCIIQHDVSTKEKVAFLPEIYSGAYFTIIAAAEANGLRAPAVGDGDSSEETTIKSLHEKLLASHWATRGWTFQEHILSKRSIIFLDGTMFWDCQRSVWWARRGTHGGRAAPGRAERESETLKELSQQLASLSVPDMALYRELVCRYNHRDLTYAEDALPAFSGVLDAFTRGFHGGFVGGLPTLFLDSVLLWQPLRMSKRRVATTCSPVETPAAPSSLPSWSWIGWQCMVDPGSLDTCLDYKAESCRDYGQHVPPESWRTRNIVEWQAMGARGDVPHAVLDGPALLERYKRHRNNEDAASLPGDWSFVADPETVSTSKEVENGSDRPLARPGGKARPTTTGCFVHASSRDGSYYHYPLPTTAGLSTDAGPPGGVSFLRCTTSSAGLRIRRFLLPRQRLAKLTRKSSALSVSILNTLLFRNPPELNTLCPVITLEDGEGRWAGVLRVMDGCPEVDAAARAMVRVVAISRGSCSYRDAVSTYEARVDGSGCYRYDDLNGDHFHFESSSTSGPRNPEVREAGAADAKPAQPLWFRGHPSPVFTENTQSGRDQGPLFDPGCFRKRWCGAYPPSEWDDKTYEFYNVLWVETRGNITYRKAAGRVSRDIFEQNCGAPETIVLG